MKDSHIILIILIVVILMARNPKKTTSEITVGENAAEKVAGAIFGGLFAAPSKGK